MKFDDVMALRPTGKDSASISDAINRAHAAHAKLEAKAAELDAQRKASLLTATDKEMEAAEKAALEARRGCDRIDALLDAMVVDLEEAESREKAERAVVMAEDANAATEAFVAWWKTEYPKHAAAIATGLALEAEATRLRAAAMAIPKGDISKASKPIPDLRWSGAEITGRTELWRLTMADAVQLPAVDGNVRQASTDKHVHAFPAAIRRTDIV